MKLSIITINLNHADGLQKTTDSILSQTYKDYEWIVIDGGSKDGSLELIESVNTRIAYWCSERDSGVYNAMNKGIAHASGEYICFMNSGDCFATSSILDEIFSEPHNADILYGYMIRAKVPHKIVSVRMMKPRLSHYDFFFENLGHQSTFTKRELLLAMGMFDESYPVLADWHFFANSIVQHNASYEFIPKIVSIYEGGGISDVRNCNEEMMVRNDLLRIRQEIYGEEFITDSNHLYANKALLDEFAWSRAILWLLIHTTNWVYCHFGKKQIRK